MKIQAFTVFVDDQQRALDFYTAKLGFHVAADLHALTTADAGDNCRHDRGLGKADPEMRRTNVVQDPLQEEGWAKIQHGPGHQQSAD